MYSPQSRSGVLVIRSELEVVLFVLEMLEGVRCVPLCMLETVEGVALFRDKR